MVTAMRSNRVHQLLAFCRRPDPHEEVEHDWPTMERMGIRCDCPCHGSGTDMVPELIDGEEDWNA